ncbi:MAG TPA: hypothetical protein VHD63_14740 [Ktedonobacteraceae bacterium]|nr:hypothetical protein [Ktedonobacteraceae bacterium]
MRTNPSGIHACLCEQYPMQALLNLVTGLWQPGQGEMARFTEHWMTCLSCQTALARLINELDIWPADSPSGGSLHHLHHTLQQLVHEKLLLINMGSYIEKLEREGEDRARRIFPEIADHLEKCAACRLDIETTQAWLRSAEAEGVLTPFG